jgi:hypothetical protein
MAAQYEGGGGLEGNLRGLKIAVVVMGVLILLGTAAIIATIIHRQMAPATPPARLSSTAALPAPAPGDSSVVLDEPAGTRIGAVVPVRDGFALLLQGGGPDRVVLIDPATGRPSERIGLAR